MSSQTPCADEPRSRAEDRPSHALTSMGMASAPWYEAPLVAVDLEGSGGQDRDHEAILEIAIVPILAGRPQLPDAFTTLINPERPLPRRPWHSPGLTSAVLSRAPALGQVTPALVTRLHRRVLVGHNIGVDWRLVHRALPDVRPAALIDTLRLARRLHPTERHHNLPLLLDRYFLTEQVAALVPGGRPHRALWDTVGTALLLPALIGRLGSGELLTFACLQHLAAHPLDHPLDHPGGPCRTPPRAEQLPLL